MVRATKITDTLFASDTWGIRFTINTLAGSAIVVSDYDSVEMNIRKPDGVFLTKNVLSVCAGVGSVVLGFTDTAGMSGTWESQLGVDDVTISRFVWYSHRQFDGKL